MKTKLMIASLFLSTTAIVVSAMAFDPHAAIAGELAISIVNVMTEAGFKHNKENGLMKAEIVCYKDESATRCEFNSK